MSQFSYKSSVLHFFKGSRQGLKESPKELLTVKCLLEGIFNKEFCTKARMLRGCKAFSFHFNKPFSLKVLGTG